MSGRTDGYTYDPQGRIASISSMAGTVSYNYSASGRLSEVHDSQGRITQYGYDNAGNRTGLSYPNGTSVSYGYDTNNRLRTLEHKNSVAQVIASYAYTLGATGNRTRIDENNGISRAYQYDNLYRLTQDAVIDPANAQTYTDDYSYDAVGNRLAKTHAAGTVPGVGAEYAFNNADQLITEDGVTYTYDLNGNLKTKTDASGTTTYTWDYEDRLVKVSGPGGTVTYEYDVDGNRVSSTTSAGTTRYLVDTNRALPQVLAEYTPAGTVTASYTYADDLISMTRGNQTRWYHFDGLGSTRLLTDEAGAVTDTYSYDAFGNLIARTGTTQNDFLFTGQQRDANAGFYYLRARYYNPAAGVLSSVDPFAGSLYEPQTLHRYIYCLNNPVNAIDPSGAFPTSLVDISIGLQITAIQVSRYAAPALYLLNSITLKLGASTVAKHIQQLTQTSTSGVYRIVGLNPKLLRLDAGTIFQKLVEPAMWILGGRKVPIPGARPDWMFWGRHIVDAKWGQYFSQTQFTHFLSWAEGKGGVIVYLCMTKPPAALTEPMIRAAKLRNVRVFFVPFM